MINKKNLIILSSDNINAQTGAAKFCKSILSAEEFWDKKNIKVYEYSNSYSFSNNEEYVKSKKHYFKQHVKRTLNSTFMGKIVAFFCYRIKFLGARPVKLVDKDLLANSVILINDIYIAINFFKKYRDRYKTIFMMHNGGDLLSMMPDEMANRFVAKNLEKSEKLIYNYASKIVFVSEFANRKFDIVHPEYKTKTCFIFNGIIEKTYNLQKRKYNSLNLVTVGSVSERKNQIAIITALNNLSDKSISLTVVGDGESLDSCISFVNKKQMSKQVSFVGSQNDVSSYLEEANAFIMTSRDEGLPIAAQEALNAHLPIIITDVGGCRDLIDGNGELINLEEVDILRAIEKMSLTVDNLFSLGERSFQIFKERFTLDMMLNNYFTLINELLS